ncbi:hypothetical protein B4110_3044 [Parageobacillus toebii]|uniref:Uncharacterized protein n=1 Tax=Parageobacillus toebii TaxID=153151 RepID=A0A150MXM2_9BACL|nr:hypothetical protein B4110_3044 [Parageobacillus toebii]
MNNLYYYMCIAGERNEKWKSFLFFANLRAMKWELFRQL